MTVEKKGNWRSIKTIEDSFKWRGIDILLIPDVSMLPEKYRKHQLASWQLPIGIESINEGWEPDWNDANQPKYWFWPEIAASEDKRSGFGFSSTDFGSRGTDTGAGSRLAYETREQALYGGKIFEPLYIDLFLM